MPPRARQTDMMSRRQVRRGLALALGKRLVASRAVGMANGSNPISVIVPCHRVIGSDGSLTGYGGGLERKELLLRLEGAGPVTLW